MTAKMLTNGRTVQHRDQSLAVGDVAGMFAVAARTVSKWFDAGRLTGWRIPDGGFRRIDPQSVVAFCRERGRPVPDELRRYLVGPRVLVVSPELDLTPHLPADWPVAWARTPFEAGMVAREISPEACVVDALMGEADARQMAATMRERCPWGPAARWLLVVAEDRFTVAAGEGFGVLLRRPLTAAAVAKAVRGADQP